MKKTYVWNTISYLLYALQSPIMLFAITRSCSIEDVGIFSLAFALASLFLCIANFGMRNYQITDLSNKFSFKEYKISRLFSIILCLIITIIYLLINVNIKNYSLYKASIIGLVCIFKFVEAGEDVFHGFYQQKSRLIDAAQLLTLRLITTLLVFFLASTFTKQLLSSLIIVTIYSYTFAIITNYYISHKYDISIQKPLLNNIINLFCSCLPLCISQILSIYITNASKYAIDGLLTEREQAYYGYLSLPVFGIALLSNIIFTPLLTTYAKYWNDNNILKFKKEIIKRFFSIGLITILVMIFGKVLGLKMLSTIYAVDLSKFENTFLLLLLGGGIMAVCNSLTFAITVTGNQRFIVWAYFGDAIFSLILASYIVEKKGILGASIFMCISFSVLLVSLTLIFIFGVSKKGRALGN